MIAWTKGSRYWTIAPLFVVLSAFLAVHFKEPSVFVTLATTWMALAGGKSIVDEHNKGKAS